MSKSSAPGSGTRCRGVDAWHGGEWLERSAVPEDAHHVHEKLAVIDVLADEVQRGETTHPGHVDVHQHEVG